MNISEKVDQYLAFLKESENLKNVTRTAWSSQGRRESTAEHSWRLAMFAAVCLEDYPNLDTVKVLEMSLIHDLGELYDGDISAAAKPDQNEKYMAEKQGVEKALAFLPKPQKSRFLALWEEYDAGKTPEARLVKALDKAETILQHIQGRNPADFDYAFNLEYGREYFEQDELLECMRERLDNGTRRKAGMDDNGQAEADTLSVSPK